MKKIAVLLIALVMVMGFAACGDREAPISTEDGGALIADGVLSIFNDLIEAEGAYAFTLTGSQKVKADNFKMGDMLTLDAFTVSVDYSLEASLDFTDVSKSAVKISVTPDYSEFEAAMEAIRGFIPDEGMSGGMPEMMLAMKSAEIYFVDGIFYQVMNTVGEDGETLTQAGKMDVSDAIDGFTAGFEGNILKAYKDRLLGADTELTSDNIAELLEGLSQFVPDDGAGEDGDINVDTATTLVAEFMSALMESDVLSMTQKGNTLTAALSGTALKDFAGGFVAENVSEEMGDLLKDAFPTVSFSASVTLKDGKFSSFTVKQGLSIDWDAATIERLKDAFEFEWPDEMNTLKASISYDTSLTFAQKTSVTVTVPQKVKDEAVVMNQIKNNNAQT